jgi:cell division protein ZipA
LDEFRWILLGLGLLLIGGIWWSGARDWAVSPLEPLSIRTADFEPVPVLETPMLAHADPVPPPAPAANAAERQKIVTIRVCAPADERWSGAQLMAGLERHGLSIGRYQVFHRNHVDGRSLFCVASLVEPGSFDISTMAEEEFRGITLFAVLPGPLEPLDTFDELVATARGLAEELSGVLQDAKGIALSVQRAAALREDVERFQARSRQG